MTTAVWPARTVAIAFSSSTPAPGGGHREACGAGGRGHGRRVGLGGQVYAVAGLFRGIRAMIPKRSGCASHASVHARLVHEL